MVLRDRPRMLHAMEAGLNWGLFAPLARALSCCHPRERWDRIFQAVRPEPIAGRIGTSLVRQTPPQCLLIQQSAVDLEINNTFVREHDRLRYAGNTQQLMRQPLGLARRTVAYLDRAR